MWPSWCHCHSLSLASVKSRLVLPFWYRLTWVVPEKGPLNGCVCVCVKSNGTFGYTVTSKGITTTATDFNAADWPVPHKSLPTNNLLPHDAAFSQITFDFSFSFILTVFWYVTVYCVLPINQLTDLLIDILRLGGGILHLLFSLCNLLLQLPYPGIALLRRVTAKYLGLHASQREHTRFALHLHAMHMCMFTWAHTDRETSQKHNASAAHRMDWAVPACLWKVSRSSCRSRRGQDSPCRSQSEWQKTGKMQKYVHSVANPRIEDG